MFDLSNKIAVITGAGSGIGAAIARAMASRRAIVYVAEQNASTGEAIAKEITAAGHQARFMHLDIADSTAVHACAQAILTEHGRCEILVNNAGIGAVGTALSTTTEADLERLWRVNVKGTLFMMQAFLPSMIERKTGSVINIASIGGVTGVRDRFAYCTTKSAIVGMSRCVAVDYAESRVRCNAICPGRVETPWVTARINEYPDPKKAYEEMSATQALKRMGTPEEIAAAAVYLASDEAAFVTGSAMILDGGWTAGK